MSAVQRYGLAMSDSPGSGTPDARDHGNVMTAAQVAEMLDLNPRTVLAMANDGRLSSYRLPGSRQYHFFYDEIVATLKANRVSPSDVDASS